MSASTQQLIAGCLSGDERSVRELVQRYQHLVFGLCLRMLGQRQDAEDASQETFLRALRSLRNFDDQRSFEPWLLAIAANRCRTLMSQRMRRGASAELPESLPDPAPDRTEARQLGEEIDIALDRLRADYRQAFVLFHQRQFSYAEIAEILERPVGTIKTWVHRARAEMVACLRARGVVQESCCEVL